MKVNSKVEAIDGFSAHADYRELIDWADNFKEKPQTRNQKKPLKTTFERELQNSAKRRAYQQCAKLHVIGLCRARYSDRAGLRDSQKLGHNLNFKIKK